MYTAMGKCELQDGSTMHLGRVLAPDAEWGAKIIEFYRPHKSALSIWHIIQGVEKEDQGGLTNYFYIERRDDAILGIINIAEHNHCCQFGHVLTDPEYRGNGICNAIMPRAIDDFATRNGKMLVLCTIRPDAFHLYEKYGFAPVDNAGFISGEPIVMLQYTKGVDEDEFYRERFAVDETFVRQPAFKDWVDLSVLTMMKDVPPLKSLCTDTKAYGRFELHTRELIYDMQVLKKPVRAKVLETKTTGAAVGFLIVRPDPRFDNHVRMMDLFVHPNFIDSADKLLASVELENGKVQVYIDHTNNAIRDVLIDAGFYEEALLKRQFKYIEDWYDVIIMAHES
jgi:RimJ/RimL family protein N-acetyltransferase